MYDPFTPDWARALREAVNASRSYRAAARRWTWSTALVVEAAPEHGVPEPRAVLLDLYQGECRSARAVAGDAPDADYVLRGDYATWKAIVRGDLDPMTALLRTRLHLDRGSLARLALHASAARALAVCAADVPTRFPDEETDGRADGTGGRPAEARPEPPHPETRPASETGSAATRAGGADPSVRSAPPDDDGALSDGTASRGDDAYRRLFRNAARLPWDPEAVDLARDRDDWAMIREEYRAQEYGEQLHRLCSLFFEGEESVAKTLSPFLGAISRAGLPLPMELHLAAQVYEEARHYAFFERYFREVIGDDDTARHMAPAPQAVLVDDLDDVADRIRRENDPTRLRALLVEGVTHYMGVVEAMLARTGYRGAGQALGDRGWLPGLQDGFRLIRRDEGRHVAFGIRFITDAVAREPEHAGIVRETFERHLPRVLETVGAFDYDHALVDVEELQAYALGAYRQFMAAAGLDEGTAGELEGELAEA